MSLLEGPQLSLIGLVGLLHLHLEGIASVGALGHGQSLSGLDADDLVLPSLGGWDNPPLDSILSLDLLDQLGDWSTLVINNQSLGLSIFNTVEDEAVVVLSLTLLGNKNLVPWGTTNLTESDDVRGSLPVLVIGAATAVIDDLVVLLVDGDHLSLTTEDSGGTVSLLALDALFLLLVPVLSLWALVLGPAALLWVALEVFGAAALGGTLLVLILSMALLVLAWVVLAWSGLADEASISQLQLPLVVLFGGAG